MKGFDLYFNRTRATVHHKLLKDGPFTREKLKEEVTRAWDALTPAERKRFEVEAKRMGAQRHRHH